MTAPITSSVFRRYRAFATIALRQRLSERLLLITRTVFLALVILVFSRVWQALLPAHAPQGLSAADCAWYVAITEWVTIASPRLFLEIERDVRSGELAYLLSRPTSYLLSKLSEALAELALSLTVLGSAGVVFTYLFAGGLPRDPSSLLWALPLGFLAGVLNVLIQAAVGLAAFWLVDCSPLWWIVQKLMFVFGGLLVPLVLYPEWLQKIAHASPFAALVYGPAQMAFGVSVERALAVAGELVLWITLAALLTLMLFKRGVRVVDLHGG